jgi:hypothetical protein
LEETFLVSAGTPPPAVSTTTGSERGKRTAQRTSWRAVGESGSWTDAEKAVLTNLMEAHPAFSIGYLRHSSGFYLCEKRHQSFPASNYAEHFIPFVSATFAVFNSVTRGLY